MFFRLEIVEWVQVITTIGTLIAGIAAWVSSSAARTSASLSKKHLEEMEKQRIKMYEPLLLFSGNTHKAILGKEEPSIYLDNVGFGPARNIRITWEEGDFLDYISESIYLGKDADFIVLTSPFDDSKRVVNKRYDMFKEIDYLLPISNENKIEVKIPRVIIQKLINNVYFVFFEKKIN